MMFITVNICWLLLFLTATVLGQPSSDSNGTAAPSPSAPSTAAPSTAAPSTARPTLSPSRSCYDSTAKLVNDIATLNGTSPTTYILCPNTVYDICFGLNCTVQTYLQVKSKNTIQCGIDGRPENNCTLRGGDYQLVITPDDYPSYGLFPDLRVTDVVIKGLTFEAARYSHFVAKKAKGSVTFQNCVFRNISNYYPIYVKYPPKDNSPIPGENMLYINFDGCVFENYNNSTIIQIDDWSTALRMNRCIFRNNNASYAIRSGTKLEIRDICLYNSSWTEWGPIYALNGSTLVNDNNFWAGKSLSTTCSFIVQSDKAVISRRTDFSCVDATAKQCMVNNLTSESFSAASSTFRDVVLSMFFAAVSLFVLEI